MSAPQRPTPNTQHLLGAFLIVCGVAASYLPRTDGQGVIRVAADWLGGSLNTLFLVLGALALVIPAYRSFGKRGLWVEFKRAAALMLAETVLVHLTKVVTGLWLGIGLRPSGGWQGFPSGHAAAATVMAYLLTVRYPRLAFFWYAFAAFISWSRAESGAHYPYQVVGGAIVGLITILLLAPRFPEAAKGAERSEKLGVRN